MNFISRLSNPSSGEHSGHPKRGGWIGKLVRVEVFIVIVGCALLLASLSIFLALSGSLNNEFRLVDNSKYQAVFLNGGVTNGSITYITYFGHIDALNSKYVVLHNVYYVTTDQSSKTASPQLIKLGCQQLHSPYDEMVINRDQVAFWENLQDSGKVVQAIQKDQKLNPNGPNCSQQTQSQPTSSTPSTQ